jgi:CubicO group peptidase (beta-lactamase class C family)
MSTISDILRDLEPTIDAKMDEWQTPGVSIGVFDDGELTERSFGIESIATRHGVTPETLFQIGSISKIFTTTLVMTLVDEGLITLDVPVIDYLSDLPLADERARQSITLRHLLTHTAGFYGDRFDDQGYGDDALARAVAAFSSLPQQTAPGEIWTYCNAGFDLAGRIVEVVTGQRFEDAMRARVFQPIGMQNVTYFAQEAILHPVAVGHGPYGDGGIKIFSPWPIPRRSNPAGGISTMPADLLRFARMHMNDGEIDGRPVLHSTSAQLMRTKQVDADAGREWGLGWSLRTVNGVLIAEHNGATNGFAARLTTIPEKQFAIAILTNGDRGGNVHSAISSAVLERRFGLKVQKPKPVEIEHSVLARYEGRYRQDLAEMELTLEDGRFAVTRRSTNPFSGEQTERQPFHFVPTGERRLIAVGGDSDGSEADLILNPDGSVRYLRFGGRLAFPVP